MNIRVLRGLASITALVFAGCTFSLPLREEQPGGDGGPDAKMADGPPGDVDGDGVLNAADNCPSVANPMQFNEDNDARGDECDPCPQLGAAADDADDDGDKIGNGCDPRRTMAGDVLAYWNGFHVASAALPSGITLLHGDPARWTVTGGSLVFTDLGDDWGMPYVDVGAVTHSIDTSFQITATYVGASAAGVAVDIATNDTDLFDCQSRLDFGGSREMWRRDPAATDGWSNLVTTAANTPVDSYRITMHRRPLDLACTTTRLDQISVEMTNGTDSVANTRAGLFARNVDVRFNYMAVYTSP